MKKKSKKLSKAQKKRLESEYFPRNCQGIPVPVKSEGFCDRGDGGRMC